MFKFYKNLFLISLFFNMSIFNAEISISSSEINAGETALLQVEIANEGSIGGFQMQILDFPNQGFFTDVISTDRTSAFTVSFNEQNDGSVIIVAFDLTGAGLSPGDGSVLELVYESTGIYTTNIELSFNEDNTVLSDMIGGSYEYDVVNGYINVLGENPPPIIPVSNLSALGSFGEVNLSWDDINDTNVEVSGYRIYRDNVFISTSSLTNYVDQGLSQSTEYCYNVSVYGPTGESDLSNTVCATTLEIYLEEPQNLTAIENGLEVSLDWETPPSAIGVGDECITAYEQPGFIDCSGICFESSLADIWIGDGFCDGVNAQYGVNFSCSFWSCDGCDCAGTTNGDQSQECIDECGSFSLSNGSLSANSKSIAEGTYLVNSRDLLGYEIYRNNELIDYVENTDYVDNSDGLLYLEDFCYNVVADYDEGSSGFSNTACVVPQLNSPSGLSVQGTGSFITLNWNSTPLNDQTSYNIYRNDELLADNILTETYEDFATEIGVEYCYYVKAFYEDIGESPATNTSCSSWNVYPPSQIVATPGDQLVNLSWQEPIGGEEYLLQYDDNVLANAFYLSGSYEGGLAHGSKFDVGVNFDVLSASVKILSEGDSFWPWPDSTHGPVRVMVFDDNNGIPGNLLHDEQAVAENGWATVYPNITGLSGSFYIIASHEDGWTDYEGFGVDASVDYPDNMYTYYYGIWNTGDYLGYGGDYMMKSQVLAYGSIENLSSSNQALDNHQERDLQTFDLYRDGNLIANFDSNTFSFTDQPLNNMQEYCYTLGSTYDEGVSELSDPVCVVPYSGPPATNLVVEDLGGTMSLTWDDATVDPLFGNTLINYQIYKDGVNIGQTELTNYIDDSEITAGVNYCYEIKANYPSGETFPSNTACGLFYLDPPVGLNAQGDNENQYILLEWNEPGSFINYSVTCDGGSWQSEVSWELIANDEVILAGGAPFSQVDVPLFLGSYTLNMADSWGDGWNGNVWNLVDASNNIAASCTLDTGSEGICEFNLTGLAVSQELYPISNEDASKNYDESINPEIEIVDNTQQFIQDNLNDNRDMLSYRIYRDGEFLVETDLNTFSHIDSTTEHDIEYCYSLRTLYDEGESVDSNISCSEWILMPATDFDVIGTNGQIELTWTPAQSADVLSYNIYRDGNFLINTGGLDNQYNDTSALHNVEYCYQISAVYDLGESSISDQECGMWEILSPDEVFASGQDGVVHVTWTDPPAGGTPGVGDECVSYDYYYNETLGLVDCIGQCVPQTTIDSWLGDGLCDDGTWGVYLDCDEYNWDGGDCPENGVASIGGEYNYRTENQLEFLLPFISDIDNNSRDLVAFNVYRDGLFIATVESGIYEYYDYDVVNLQEYCYTVTSVYEVGESEILEDLVCAIPIPGLAPSSLYAYAESDYINLEWNAGSNLVIDYNVYRNGVLYDNTTDIFYQDLNAEHDIEYCYVVSANYESGESQFTNESCAMWILAPPLTASALGGNGFIQLDWTEPGVSTCADEVISSLPFSALGSNAGMSNDWLVQGSEGADYAYLLNVTSPITIDVTLCSANTTFDTKLEIFTADQECNEITTGYYIDDFTCEFSGLQSTLQGVFLDPGQYYIVVDGYSGAEGNYEINVTQSFFENSNPSEIVDNLLYESNKSNLNLNIDDWNYADNDLIQSSRSLLGFDIYRDNQLINSVDSNTYTYLDLGLENGTQYCYFIIANYDEGDSQPTPTICASPDAGPMCPPENLALNIEDGDTVIDMTWDLPNPNCEGAGTGGGDGSYSVECGGGSWESEVSWELLFDGNIIQNGVVGSYSFDLDPGDYVLNMYDSYGDGWNGNSWNLYNDAILVASCSLEYDYYNYGDGSFGSCQFSLTGVASNDEVLPVDVYNYFDPDKPAENMNNTSRIEGFNIYKNDILIDSVPIDQNYYTDSDVIFGEEYCYKVKALYEEGESNPTNIVCGTVIDPGSFSVMGLENGIVQSGSNIELDLNLSNQTSVAGFQFTLTDTPNNLTVTSVETTDRTEGFTVEFNEQVNGSVIIVAFNITGGLIAEGDGSILSIIYEADEVFQETNVELSIADYYIGDSIGFELPIYTEASNVLISLGPTSIVQEINLDPFIFNNVSLNVIPDNISFSQMVDGMDLLLASDGSSNFYVPSYDIDQIGDMHVEYGYRLFLNGAESHMMSVEGVPVDVSEHFLTLNPFILNLVSYLPQECLMSSEIFAGYDEDILLVKGSGGYYVPSFGVQTLDQMCPGEAFEIFLNGTDGLDFQYPTGVMSSNHSNHFVEDYKSRTRTYDVERTGESHLVLLTELSGEVSVGDQLRAYANGKLVGSINIVPEHLNGTHPVDLVAVGSIDLTEFAGPVLDGYIAGDMIELRLWSVNKSVELKVSSDLSDAQYGNAMELSTGTASVLNEGAIVTSLSLTQNYPNPFNPSTTISYNVDVSGMVTLKVYDVMGRLVRTLVDGYKISGYESGYSVVWDGKDQQGQQVSAGLYIYSLQTPSGIKTKKMVLMK